jgi:predicted ferric reductase
MKNNRFWLSIAFVLTVLFWGSVAFADTRTVTPWTWYISRASGLLGFSLLYIVIFLGLAIRISGLKRIIPPSSLQAHCWISIQAFIFILIHGFSLLFDSYMRSQNFTVWSVLIPFISSFRPTLIALGIIGMYLMLMLIFTSYFRRFMFPRFWRIIHFSNIVLYVFVAIHSFYLGTDLKNGPIRFIFLAANGLLIILFVLNLFFRIRIYLKHKKAELNLRNNYNGQTDENLRESYSEIGQKRSD